MLLPLLILATLGYVGFAIASSVRELRVRESRSPDALHPAAKFVFAGGIPTIVVATMTYLFLIVGGATTVQFNVGSPSRMNVWSTWVDQVPPNEDIIQVLLKGVTLVGGLVWLLGLPYFFMILTPKCNACQLRTRRQGTMNYEDDEWKVTICPHWFNPSYGSHIFERAYEGESLG